MKFSRTFRGPLLGLLTAFTLTSAVSVIHPSVAQAQGLQIGVVDEDKLAEGYKKYAAAVTAIDKMAQELDAKIPAREYLTPEEGKKFDDAITQSVSLTAAPNQTLEDLKKVGLDRRASYTSLIGKAPRTDAETSQMNVFQGYAATNRVPLGQLSDKLLQMVRDLQDKTDKQYTDQANTVVAQVANDKKLLMIVRKKALIFSADSVDVTAEVLNRLNK